MPLQSFWAAAESALQQFEPADWLDLKFLFRAPTRQVVGASRDTGLNCSAFLSFGVLK